MEIGLAPIKSLRSGAFAEALFAFFAASQPPCRVSTR